VVIAAYSVPTTAADFLCPVPVLLHQRSVGSLAAGEIETLSIEHLYSDSRAVVHSADSDGDCLICVAFSDMLKLVPTSTDPGALKVCVAAQSPALERDPSATAREFFIYALPNEVCNYLGRIIC